jgi:hypothetical protein
MANNQCDHNSGVRVEQVRLPDGRRAERHINKDEQGNEVVEIFAEEQRPLKLEERIVREHKRIVAKETREIIRDGEVAHVEVRTLEPEVPLQIRERIGVAEHSKVVDGDYVRKEEIGQLVADGVVAGVEALMENMEPAAAPAEEYEVEEPVVEKPIFNAQSVVEKNVSEKKKSDGLVNGVLAVILVAQVAFFGYMFFVM